MLGASVVATVSAAVWLMSSGKPGAWPVGLFIIATGGLLPIWLVRTTVYVLSADRLDVRSGPFRWKVPLHEIRKISPSRNILSSPAFSLDRLRIDYGRGKFILISPAEREAFLRDLEARRGAVATSSNPRASK